MKLRHISKSLILQGIKQNRVSRTQQAFRHRGPHRRKVSVVVDENLVDTKSIQQTAKTLPTAFGSQIVLHASTKEWRFIYSGKNKQL